MKKEWWIIGILVIVIIILFIIIIIPKQTNNTNPINQTMNNSDNNCNLELTELEKLMSSFNYCNIDTDCVMKNIGLMDFCGGHLINKNVNLDEFNAKLNKYTADGCSQPVDMCSTSKGELKCINKKCVYNQTLTNTDSGQTCTSDSDCPALGHCVSGFCLPTR